MKLSKILMFAALFALTACGGGKGAEVDENVVIPYTLVSCGSPLNCGEPVFYR